MFRRILNIVLCVIFALLCTACQENTQRDGTSSGKGTASVKPNDEFKMPEKLISEKDYINGVEELCAYDTFSVADEKYLKKVDKLGDDLADMITYNHDEVEISGTKYYVAADGKDSNDGLSPKTPWKTLDKVARANVKPGDAILFKRGDFFRGQLNTISGITYSAYGEGYKPIIANSINAFEHGKWIKTDKENIWKLDTRVQGTDTSLIVFNMGESYAQKTLKMEELKKNFVYCHNNSYSSKNPDGYIYMYCDKGNPADLFWSIEISNDTSVVNIAEGQSDIRLHNLSLYFGGMIFFPSKTKNIASDYCYFAWNGGFHKDTVTRFGGGAGAWLGCDAMTFNHCYIYQMYDSGVTPQYAMTDNEEVAFKRFETKACLFEYCEWTYEFFLTHDPEFEGDGFYDCYFGYNFCRKGGYGFGDKPLQSSYVQSWTHPNPTTNHIIEKNIFDRAYSRILQMGARNEEGELDLSNLPTMKNNVYIGKKNRKLIKINEKLYPFNEKGYKELEDMGFETDAVYMFIEK